MAERQRKSQSRRGRANRQQDTFLLTVGIGASAGGLEAFKHFLAAMPADSGMAFVLVQHLDPDHSSMLSELLGRTTTMTVAEAEDGVRVTADQVYVIPPDATLTIARGCLKVAKPARAQRRPIDSFLQSLAEECGEHAVCVILSGVGSDGALGLRKIKECGGLTIAQAGGGHEAMSGMPRSAADTGLVDHILAIEDMPAQLQRYQHHLANTAPHKSEDGTRHDAADFLGTITDLLASDLDRDFSRYKEKTLIRRIQRRMQVLDIDAMADYVARLRNDAAEMEALFRELLIGVTQFFRDPAAWDALQSQVLEKLVAERGADAPLRIWVAGCATGEEVYSLAISLKEFMRRREVSPPVQIFATDIDDQAIRVARIGRYFKPAPSLSAARIDRWFTPDEEGYYPVKEIRDMCVFAVHDLVKDPPFSKLDLLLCRNLLIYMNTDLQDSLLRRFHYALKPGGHLFLGLSESVSRNATLFHTVDKKQRLFRRSEGETMVPLELSVPVPAKTTREPTQRDASATERVERRAREIMDKHSPAYVVINREQDILRFSGGEIGRYLEPSAGAASLNLLAMVKAAFRPAVRSAVQRAFAENQPIIQTHAAVQLEDGAPSLCLIVEPLSEPGGAQTELCVVAFREEARVAHDNAEADSNTAALKSELQATKNQLAAVLRDLDTTNEEAKSASEEYQSVNEELQSSNEELETSKEEMQSINEELQTINTELSSKNEQLTRLNSDLRNLLESTQIATIFLDSDLRVKNYTPGMKDLFHLRTSDRDRPLTDITTRLDYADLKRDVANVLRDLSMIEREVHLEGDRDTA